MMKPISPADSIRIGIEASNMLSGGAQRYLSSMLAEAAPQESGISTITVWGGRHVLSHLPERPWLNARHESWLDGALHKRLLWQRLRLTRLARAACDLLFVPGGLYSGGFRPYVAMSQNMLPFQAEERRRYGFSWTALRLLLIRRGQVRCFQDADGMVFLSRFASQRILSELPNIKDPMTIIPFGISQVFFKIPVQQKPIASYSFIRPFRFLYISPIEQYKHQWIVVQAVDRLRKQDIPVTLDLVGPAGRPALKKLEQAMKQVNAKNPVVTYRGYVSFNEMVSLSHQSDAFIFASSCENLPNILLEAMASGLPIACSNRGPMPEILGDAGVYFDPTDAEQTAEAMRRLALDPDLRTRCAQTSFQKAQGYSWARCARETLSFLANVYARWRSRDGNVGD